MINLNKLARKVTMLEGGKQSISIAQVKEVIRLYNMVLGEEKASSILRLLKK